MKLVCVIFVNRCDKIAYETYESLQPFDKRNRSRQFQKASLIQIFSAASSYNTETDKVFLQTFKKTSNFSFLLVNSQFFFLLLFLFEQINILFFLLLYTQTIKFQFNNYIQIGFSLLSVKQQKKLVENSLVIHYIQTQYLLEVLQECKLQSRKINLL